MSTASKLAQSGPLALPRICCLDLDTFFVSVERVLDPSLEGKPVVVGGRPGSRGVVTAASYEVRRLGVKAGMSLVEAGKLAPDAVYLPTRGEIYGRYSGEVQQIAQRYSPVVRIASIDEMFIDLSGCERLYGRPDDESPDVAIERAVGARVDPGGAGAEAFVHELRGRMDLAVLPIDGLPFRVLLDFRFKLGGLLRRDLAVDVQIQ